MGLVFSFHTEIVFAFLQLFFSFSNLAPIQFYSHSKKYSITEGHKMQEQEGPKYLPPHSTVQTVGVFILLKLVRVIGVHQRHRSGTIAIFQLSSETAPQCEKIVLEFQFYLPIRMCDEIFKSIKKKTMNTSIHYGTTNLLMKLA